MLTRLADILVIQAIRFWLATAPEAKQDWLAAARNEHIGQALSAIHRRPYGWRGQVGTGAICRNIWATARL